MPAKRKIDPSLRKLMRETDRARQFPVNTCPASRHVHIMAECLAEGGTYHMFAEEPQHCAESLLAVLADLWKLRTAAAKRKRQPLVAPGGAG